MGAVRRHGYAFTLDDTFPESFSTTPLEPQTPFLRSSLCPGSAGCRLPGPEGTDGAASLGPFLSGRDPPKKLPASPSENPLSPAPEVLYKSGQSPKK